MQSSARLLLLCYFDNSARLCFFCSLLTPLAAMAASKPRVHVISFGKTMAVKLFLGPDEEQTMPMKVRALYVDAKVKEFVTGDAHEVTDRLFVVRRAYRLNNNLPRRRKQGSELGLGARRMADGGPA